MSLYLEEKTTVVPDSTKINPIPVSCVVCGKATIFICSTCNVISGGKNKPYLCSTIECQEKHQALVGCRSS